MGSFKAIDPITGQLKEFYYTTVAVCGSVKIVVSNGNSKNLKPIEVANSPNAIYA